jgi:hypothetical protein
MLAEPFKPQAGLEDFQLTGIEEWVRQHRLQFFDTERVPSGEQG